MSSRDGAEPMFIGIVGLQFNVYNFFYQQKHHASENIEYENDQYDIVQILTHTSI